MTRVAVIDLGTNTFHLLVADIGLDRVQVIHKEKLSVKIGESGISQGMIGPAARDRAIHALKGFKQKIDSLNVSQVHATATSAFRNATNGRELADEIYQLTGIRINIIDGKKEAQLIYQGVSQALRLDGTNALIMDIGGGSVEFVIVQDDRAQWMQSFEIGAQRLMDMFHHNDPIGPEELKNLDKFLDQQLTSLINALNQYQPGLLIGASGTFDTLSQIFSYNQGVQPIDQPEQPLTIDGFHEIHQQIIKKNRYERLAMKGMVEMRVDMIVVASSLIHYILRKYHFDQVRVSTYALKEGMLSEVSVQLREANS
jgi:exopolyphosphatase/guanosine-5'-triphosphate,3'-diphosphate pyrophosphatase